MDKNEVKEAFEILLEEIEAVANALNEEGAQAFCAGDYSKTKSAIEEANWLAEFRERSKSSKRNGADFSRRSRAPEKKKADADPETACPTAFVPPEDAFRRPILETLAELGGSAPIGEVLSRVQQKMQDVLNEHDREPLPSDPRSVRWRNTAQWCRNTLVREGLMKGDSSYGIWEISEQGHKWLTKEEN